ncbi:complement factor H-related protein 3-like isoform X2 [Dromiciops gliroides]|uniref:complement factor H-related protein 3-like isoform X2 n=1 Tax=Dromiciops gliroides TaxID=33562 RepID=UPI001CC52C78|nr:complement factor H-related protein 3-like isoform X2 [Dromiciops gliroides]
MMAKQNIMKVTVWYQCSPGTTPVGSEWIECREKNWTPLPKCSVPCTITRQQLEEKKLVLSNGQSQGVIILHNQSLEFSCANGYTLTKPNSRTCMDGHMDFPTCISEEVGKCGPPPPINNGGTINFLSPEYAPGSTVEYRCQQFYVLQGSPIVTCRNGLWTKEPTCLEACIASKEMMSKNNIELRRRNDDRLYVRTGQEMEFTCRWGYRLAPRSPPLRATCVEGKINYPKCI